MKNKEIDFDNIVYVDLDDTMCQFKKHFLDYIIKNPANKFPQSTYKFFETIEPIEGAIYSIKELATKYDVWILTRPSVLNPLCYTEKRVWVENHLGMEWCEKLILSPNKTLFKGKYLIDDVKWKFDGEQLLFGSAKFPDWKSVLNYLM